VKRRLDSELVKRRLVTTRSQAENYIKLGKVEVNGKVISKAGHFIGQSTKIELTQPERYVGRAALKLASVAKTLGLEFRGRIILDVGSSTGGFTDFALQNGAERVIAVDVGTKQLHPSLLSNPHIELHEQTDIRDFKTDQKPDLILIDVSFISLRQVLPSIAKIAAAKTRIVAMLKPQFEAGDNLKHGGVIKNDAIRRGIIRQFESWLKKRFVIINKADSKVAGAKGNQERFYLLTRIKR